MSEPFKILFVCLGNICRSPMAETIMQKRIDDGGLAIEVDSAGISAYHQGEQADLRMRAAAREHGYSITHRSRQVRRSDFALFDMIVAMDDSNYDDLMEMAVTSDEENKIVRINQFFTDKTITYVPDPYYGGANGFTLVINMLEDAVDNMITFVEANHKN